MTILSKSSTKNLILIAIVSSLLTQITHAADLFGSISRVENPYLNTFLNYVFAFGLELSIFIFTLKAKKNTATFFALISFLINILYYYPKLDWGRECLSSIVISLIVPVAIWFYSDLILEEMEQEALDNIYNITPEKSVEIETIPVQQEIIEEKVEKLDNIIQFDPNEEILVEIKQPKVKKPKTNLEERFNIVINEETNKYEIKRNVAGRVSQAQKELELNTLAWYNENKPLEAKPVNIEKIQIEEPEVLDPENIES